MQNCMHLYWVHCTQESAQHSTAQHAHTHKDSLEKHQAALRPLQQLQQCGCGTQTTDVACKSQGGQFCSYHKKGQSSASQAYTHSPTFPAPTLQTQAMHSGRHLLATAMGPSSMGQTAQQISSRSSSACSRQTTATTGGPSCSSSRGQPQTSIELL
jgi:hypothetical protein